MKRSHVIALAGISAALAYVAIILSFYVDVMSVSFGVIAAIAIMLPLTVGSITGAVFSYISASVLAGLTVGFGAMSFIIFYGPFSLVCFFVDFRLYDKMRLPKWAKITVAYLIEGIFYSGLVTALYFVMKAFGNVDVIFEGNMKWLSIVALILIFFLYDILVRLVYINLERLITRRILKINPNGRDTKKTSSNEIVKSEEDIDVFGIEPHEETINENREESQHVEEPSKEDVNTPKDDGEKVDESTSRFEHFLKAEKKDEEDKEDKEN